MSTDRIEQMASEYRENAKQIDALRAAEPAEKFMAKVRDYRNRHACTQSEAVGACVDLFPQLHAKMAYPAPR